VKKVKRLFSEFKPTHYDLYLAPDRDNMTFDGTVKISGQRTGKPSQRITLHQKGLKVTAASVVKHDKKRGDLNVVIDRINCHESFDEVRLHANEMLYPGEYDIELEFSGKITDQMHGIYPCYFKHDGQDKKLIATQFESHHAREAFPCIDEPEAKATFDLSLLTPGGETVLANTPIKDQSKKDGKLLTSFETTPLMSTYLLAFVFGELVMDEGRTKSGVNVRSYGTPLAEGLLDYSVEAAVKSVEFFEDYFGVPYPLPKLDMVALPDFSSGAMENWGLITYRESVMWVHPANSGIETKQVVSLVVAHEISHQWFGNLVTMKWWDDLWLNESFANLMEYQAVDRIHPQWNIFEQFVNSEMNMAMRRDALPNVQPVRTEVHHPDEIGSLFDPAIVYAKGGNILRMLANYLGENDFRKGLSAYFKEHAYGNTTADDLWSALSQASGKNINELMINWLTKPGYPVVSVDYTPDKASLVLAQNRLVIGEADDDTVWSVPLAANAQLETPLLETKESSLKVQKASETLLLNHSGQSYFIPLYKNQQHLDSIVAALEQGRLDATDRLLLLMHGSILETAGLSSTLNNLQLAGALQDEEEEAVWSAIAGIIGSARRLIGLDEKSEEKLNGVIQELVARAVDLVGWETKANESAQTQRLRNLILGMAAGAQAPDVLARGQKLFADFKQPSDLAPDVRGTVYFVGARFGSDADFQKLLNLYKTIENADEKDEISSALTSSRQPEQIKELLGMITSVYVRLQDVPRWFAWMIRNKYAAGDSWQWLKDNWGWVVEKYGDDKSFDAFPRYSAMAFSTRDELATYKEFFESKRAEPSLTRTIDLGVEEIEGRIKWRERNESELKNWLKKS
jgi:aminopeptidase N